jgi:uncharacterized protein YkwD
MKKLFILLATALFSTIIPFSVFAEEETFFTAEESQQLEEEIKTESSTPKYTLVDGTPVDEKTLLGLVENDLIDLINQHRLSLGLSYLTFTPAIKEVNNSYVIEEANKDFMSFLSSFDLKALDSLQKFNKSRRTEIAHKDSKERGEKSYQKMLNSTTFFKGHKSPREITAFNGYLGNRKKISTKKIAEELFNSYLGSKGHRAAIEANYKANCTFIGASCVLTKEFWIYSVVGFIEVDK